MSTAKGSDNPTRTPIVINRLTHLIGRCGTTDRDHEQSVFVAMEAGPVRRAEQHAVRRVDQLHLIREAEVVTKVGRNHDTTRPEASILARVVVILHPVVRKDSHNTAGRSLRLPFTRKNNGVAIQTGKRTSRPTTVNSQPRTGRRCRPPSSDHPTTQRSWCRTAILRG